MSTLTLILLIGIACFVIVYGVKAASVLRFGGRCSGLPLYYATILAVIAVLVR